MEVNEQMFQSALERLQYWRDQLRKAERAGDPKRIQECGRLIRRYRVLLEEMADALKNHAEP